MDNGLIPQRYAKALYKMAMDKGNAPQVYREMAAVAQAFRQNPDLQRTLANPYIAPADKTKLLEAAAGPLCESDFKAFIKLILEHHREEYAYRMALDFCGIYREENKISRVRIITAEPLGEKEMTRLKSLVQNAFPGRTMEFSEETDPALIGGFVVYVDSVKMDASISNELEQLRHKLLSSN